MQVSGEIIQLSNQMTMMFEVGDLAMASPATVSRCGMVYMEPKGLGFEPLLASWLRTLPRAIKPQEDLLASLFNGLAEKMIEFMRQNLTETVTSTDTNLVQSLFRLMDSLCAPFRHMDKIEQVRNKGPMELADTEPMKKLCLSASHLVRK